MFFRAGKHTIHWGTGYFFSPADVLNLTSIDPEEPEEQREGPVSLKTHIPVNVHNGYLYLIVHDIDKPDEIAAAPKIEFVIGNTETGIGAYIRKDDSPRGVVAVTTPFLDLDLFGEAVVSYGSDITFIRETDEDMVLGLGIGADDFVTKPFSPKVLAARVRAHLRRFFNSHKDTKNVLHFGPLPLTLTAVSLINGERG